MESIITAFEAVVNQSLQRLIFFPASKAVCPVLLPFEGSGGGEGTNNPNIQGF